VLLVVLSLLVAALVISLTPGSGFFPHAYLLLRLALPGLLVAGIVGAGLRVKSMLALGKAGGWVFILYAFAEMVTDPEDYWSAGKEYPGSGYFLSRFFFLSLVVAAILICFRELGTIIETCINALQLV
jgi:hypothetical protein